MDEKHLWLNKMDIVLKHSEIKVMISDFLLITDFDADKQTHMNNLNNH